MNLIALAIIVVGFPLALIGFLLTRSYCRASSKGYVSVHNDMKTDADAARKISAAGVATASGGRSAAHAVRFASIAALCR
jgi:thioredoxin reductase